MQAPLLRDIDEKERSILLKAEPAAAQRSTNLQSVHPRYHIGLFLREGKSDQLTPQFPLGWPTLLGSAYSVFGWNGLQSTNAILSLVASLLLASLAAGWFGSGVGVSVFLIHLFLPLNVWISRTLFGEPALEVTWLLLVTGIRFHSPRPAWSGLICGSSVGVLLFLKIEALLVLPLILAVVVWHWKPARRFAVITAITAAASASLGCVSWWQFNRFYVADTLGSVNPKVFWTGGLAMIVIAAALSSDSVREWLSFENRWLRLSRLALFWLLILLSFYGAILRRDPTSPDTYFYWPAQKLIRSFREETFWRLSWYWQPWGLVLASIGLSALVFWLRRSWQVSFCAIGIIFLVGLSFDIRNNPIQPYAMRRLLPFAMPLLIMGAAMSARVIADRITKNPKSRRSVRCVALIAVTSLLVIGFTPINDVLNGEGDFQGVRSEIGEIARRLPPNAVVLANEASLLSWVATPLQFIFERETLTLGPRVFQDPVFQDVVKRWRSNGRPVYLLTESPGVEWIEGGNSQVLNPTEFGTLRTSYLFQSPVEPPSRRSRLELAYYLVPLDTW